MVDFAKARNGSGAVADAGPVMIERKEPEFIKWGDGEILEGILTSIERIDVADRDNPKAPKKKVVKFTVEEQPPGEYKSFLGTYDLVQKLKMEDRGHFVRIRYEGPDSSITRNGNPMKRFKVEVSQDAMRTGRALEESTLITDEDIPF